MRVRVCPSRRRELCRFACSAGQRPLWEQRRWSRRWSPA